jgi:hypothetical protein
MRRMVEGASGRGLPPSAPRIASGVATSAVNGEEHSSLPASRGREA